MTDLEQEVQELRKQVERLAGKQAAKEERPLPPEEQDRTDEDGDLSKLGAKFDELLGTLQQDLEAIPAPTAIGIFALGLLMGRLLPR